ncbi:MAG: PepSY domain-containing protein [Nanoarchaeota archaeon]|nr:PepSY domain-containing protein [Nanoarchaeota archaeon]
MKEILCIFMTLLMVSSAFAATGAETSAGSSGDNPEIDTSDTNLSPPESTDSNEVSDSEPTLIDNVEYDLEEEQSVSSAAIRNCVCTYDETDSEEYKELLKDFNMVRKGGDTTQVSDIKDMLSQAKRTLKKQCTCPDRKDDEEPRAFMARAEPMIHKVNHCKQLLLIKEKIEHYESMKQEAMDTRGLTEEGHNNILAKLEQDRIRYRKLCGIEQPVVAAELKERIQELKDGGEEVQDVFFKPVAPTIEEAKEWYDKKIEEEISAEEPITLMGSDEPPMPDISLIDEAEELMAEAIMLEEEVNFEDVNDVIDEITMSEDAITVGSRSVNPAKKRIKTMLGKRHAWITKEKEMIKMSMGEDQPDIMVMKQVKLQGDKMLLGDRQVKYTPHMVKVKTKTTIVLDEEGERAVYKIKEMRKKKLFGFVPWGSKEVEQTVDAGTGEVISTEGEETGIVSTGMSDVVMEEAVETA